MQLQFFNNYSYSIIQGAKAVAQTEYLAVALGMTGTIRYSEIALHALVGLKTYRWFDRTSFLSIGAVPLSAYEMGKNGVQFSKASWNERSEILLKMVSNVSSIGYAFWTFMSALQDAGVHSKLMAGLPILGIVSAAFEGIAMTLDFKGVFDTARVSLQFEKQVNLAKKIEEYTLIDFRQGLKFIEEAHGKEPLFINKYFDTEEEWLIDHLLEIERISQTALFSGNPEETMAAKTLMHSTMHSLQKRLTTKKWSHCLNLNASAVSLIGVGLLFSPIPTVGLGLFAVSGLINLGTYFYKKKATRQFKIELSPKTNKTN